MDIYATISILGVPVNGLTDPPEIRIRDGANTVVQAFAAMTDLGADGKYLFSFPIPNIAESYTFLIDADPLVSGQVPTNDRFYYGGFPGEGDVSKLPAAYQAGVWIDTVGGGSAGSAVGVNGLQTNPTDNITDALILATALNIRSFKIRGPITLNAAFPAAIWEAVAGGGVLDPAGFDVGGGIFIRVGLTGVVNTGTGAIFGFETSLIGPVSGVVGVLTRPGLAGAITLGAGTSTIASGASLVPGLSTPIIDLNGVASLNLRSYSGGIDLRGSSTGGQNSSIEIVAGQVILDASNTAGTIAVRGWPNVIDNSAGATINTDGLGAVEVDQELTANHGGGSWQGDPALAAILLLREFIEGGRDIDFVGNDAAGWQRIERDTAGALLRRYNLFDENGARIDETVPSFLARQGMISSEVAI